MIIYHLTSSTAWKAAELAGSYTAESLTTEGFIHCSTADQLLRVANTFYIDALEPIVLWIDSERLAAPLRWESPVHADPMAGEVFPHVFGEINLNAVDRITELIMGETGQFIQF